MKPIQCVFAFLMMVETAFASGWNDYSLDIGDGYMVFRANSLDVCIARTGGRIILFPQDYKDVGPVVAYNMRDEYILTRNAGRVPRNHFEGDTFEEVDFGKEWYFFIPKATDKPVGPYEKTVFMNLMNEKGITNVEWIEPRNPNFWSPVLGNSMFILMAIPFLAVKYFYISIPLVALSIWGIRKILKKRKLSKSQEVPV
jgi:hypothetical protein